eukprot:2558905-Pleurochrysis_carterae.AAC.1
MRRLVVPFDPNAQPFNVAPRIAVAAVFRAGARTSKHTNTTCPTAATVAPTVAELSAGELV